MAPFELLARSSWLGILAWWHWSICLWWWGNKKLPGTEGQVIWSCYTNTVIACFISHQHDIIFFWFFFLRICLRVPAQRYVLANCNTTENGRSGAAAGIRNLENATGAEERTRSLVTRLCSICAGTLLSRSIPATWRFVTLFRSF